MLREEEVRALDDEPEVRFALRVNERGNVRDVDGLGACEVNASIVFTMVDVSYLPTTARNEQVRLEPQVRAIPEVGTVDDNLTRYMLHQSQIPRTNRSTTHKAT